MKDNTKMNPYEGFLISKDNIITEVNRKILELTGFTERELIGKTLVEVNKVLRIDSQVNLQEIREDTTLILFTKELAPIEGKISCKPADDGVQRIFSFKMAFFNYANEKFNLADQLGTNRGDSVAIFSYPELVLINGNQNILNSFNIPFNIKTNCIGEKLTKIVPEYLSFGYEEIRNHIERFGTPYYIEEKCVYLNNYEKEYWNLTVVPVSVEHKVDYIILSLANVTEKVLNRKMIEQRNVELEAIIKNISDEIIIFEKSGDILHSNKEVGKQFVLDNPSRPNLNDILKNTVTLDKDNQVIQSGDYPFQRVSRGEIVLEYEMKIETTSGILHREVSGTPIYDKAGNFSGGVMVYRDIRSRLEIEEARLIKTQNDLLNKVVESLGLEFVRCSYPDFKIISISGDVSKSLELSPIGKNYFDMYPVNEERKKRELYDNFIRNKRFSYIENTTHIVNGKRMFFKTLNQPILGLDKKIVELIFISIDITHEVKAKNKVEETLEMQNQMFSTISHELKTPLSVIFSASQLIELDLKREITEISIEDMNKNVHIIKQNCYRFTKLINNIIDISRMESGFYKLNYKNGNIIEIIENMVDSVRGYVESRGLYIIFDTEVEERMIAIDVDKIERIILNLLSNAAKFSPKGATIYVDIKDKADFVSIHVRDCGVGIKKEYLNTIFDKYKKIDNTLARNAEGSGIGLALVKTIVGLIDGEISVESELGKGSLFIVKLPVKVLDESKVISTMRHLDNRIEQINIELSDIYPK